MSMRRYPLKIHLITLTTVLVILVDFADWKHTSGEGTPLPDEPAAPPSSQPSQTTTWWPASCAKRPRRP